MTKLVLAGGGDADNSRLLDQCFARLTGNRRMVYIPVALDEKEYPYDMCFEMFRYVYEPLGFEDISMWTEISDRNLSELQDVSAVYLGGGNTYRLLHTVRSTGFDRILQEFTRQGGLIYGKSAGAIILGHNIGTAAHLDTDKIGVTEIAGLNLYHDYAFWCHYQPKDDALISEYLSKYGTSLIAIPDGSGVYLNDQKISAAGADPSYVFRGGKKITVWPGYTVPV